MGTCGTGNGAEGVYHAFAHAIDQRGLDVQLVQTGCFGFCAEEPLVNVRIPASRSSSFIGCRPITSTRCLTNWRERSFRTVWSCARSKQRDHITAQVEYGAGNTTIPAWHEISFLKGQKKIVLRNCGLINPDDIEEYIAIGGYRSLQKVLLKVCWN